MCSPRRPPPIPLVLPAGATKLLPFWDEDARSLQRDWHEDGPRELCVQLEGEWLPLVGIVVSQPNTTVLPLKRLAAGRGPGGAGSGGGGTEGRAEGRGGASTRASRRASGRASERDLDWTPGTGAPPRGAPRCVVCEVVLHERGTRLTIRSMLTLINGTSRTLIADLASDLAPLRHLGILAPADVLPIPENCLECGLRLIDAGADAATQRAALDAADAREAAGVATNVMWLSALTCAYEGKPTAEEEAAWRATFERPEGEHLVRCYASCTLGEKSGDLYLGSHSMHFKPKDAALSMKSKASKLLRWYALEWHRVLTITKKSGKLSGYKGFVIVLAPTDGKAGGGGGGGGSGSGSGGSRAGASDKGDAITLSGFAWANEVRHTVEALVAERSAHFDRAALEENVRTTCQRERLQTPS